MEIARGNIVLVVLHSELGKPRPAVVVQADALGSRLTTIVCPMSSDVGVATLLRPVIEPTGANALRVRSQIMTDKISAVSRDRVRKVLGRITAEDQARLDLALQAVLDLGLVR
jgi:mRNA interferase MazF